MKKGIIYVMSSVINGLIKIGKTNVDGFEERMRNLEQNGYANVTGLRREFAIIVEGHDEKEKLLFNIFSKSRVENKELFALDRDIVIQLLSSFEGEQIYPTTKSKKDVFEEVTEELEEKGNLHGYPSKQFYLRRTVKNFGKCDAVGYIKNGKFIVKKGSKCRGIFDVTPPKFFDLKLIKNNILQEDVVCNSPSMASLIVLGKSSNGWTEWKDAKGETLDKYRKNKN